MTTDRSPARNPGFYMGIEAAGCYAAGPDCASRRITPARRAAPRCGAPGHRAGVNRRELVSSGVLPRARVAVGVAAAANRALRRRKVCEATPHVWVRHPPRLRRLLVAPRRTMPWRTVANRTAIDTTTIAITTTTTATTTTIAVTTTIATAKVVIRCAATALLFVARGQTSPERGREIDLVLEWSE
ncbi:PREDICTED: uncharacterized protein LOC106749715 [Dinoponera quadriceps]|uniref:Uncharacterized protein LOC106749715 n=1 Tax=Dinoponera quadriceps TaxID=609295 RepID=A0A6P3Y3U7_DINQU|nr:PREDICTED: uncharacterized protein LOC106749715 [Dinoponera quadriceps]